MRTSLLKMILALTFVAVLGGLAVAGETPAKVAAKPAGTPTDPGQRQVTALMRRYEQIGLTEEQKNTIRPLLKSQVDELRALRMDRDITEDERQTRARTILETYRDQIEGSLTAEQKTRLQELREANRKAVRTAATQKARGPVADEE